MSDTSNTEQGEGATSSSDFDRDLLFYTSLTFVLEPKEKSSAPSADVLKHAVSKLDPQATTTKDTRSKNYWLHASTKRKLENIQKFLLKKASLEAFTIREVRPGSPEEERVRRHIAKWLASTASASNEEPATSRTSGDPPGTTVDRSRQRPSAHRSRQDQSSSFTNPEVDKAEPSIPKESFARDSGLPEGMDRSRSTRRRAAPRQGTATPSYSSTSSEPSVSSSSRALGKRPATSPPLSDHNNAPVFDVDGSDSPEIHDVERPQKRVRIDLRRNTYKYFTEEDEPEPIPSHGDTSGGAQPAPTINELPSACLQRILIYGTPCPASNPAKVYRSALYGLISVCSKWKGIAESTPSLWSHLSNANPPGMLEACIQRSTTVTVAVHFDGTVEYPSKVQSALEAFVDKVAPHRLRWKSVQLNNVPPTWESYLAVARAFNGPAPRLVSAKVTTIYGGTMPFVESLRFFGGEAQALRHITLSGIVPNLSDVPLFMNIESLRIIRPMGVCPAYVLRILARNNKLKTLELVEVRPSYARLFQNIETLELPELLHFKLHLLGEKTIEMAQLFTRLRAPKCRRLDLALDMDNLKNLKLEFNMLEFDREAFLVDLGAWMSNWIVLNRASSVIAWVDGSGGAESGKSAVSWRYGGAVNGSYRGRSADVRLEVENRRAKEAISRWAEDVQVHAELVEAGVRRGVRLGDMESFRSYRERRIKDREPIRPGDDIQPDEFMGIWDIGSLARR